MLNMDKDQTILQTSLMDTDEEELTVAPTDEFSLRVDLADISDESREEYLDRYEGMMSEILSITRFNENSHLSTAYLENQI